MEQITITVDGRTYEFEPSSDLDRLLDAIARRRLGVATGLRTRDSDRLDFYDCHVGGLRAALAEAYEAGRLSAKVHDGALAVDRA